MELAVEYEQRDKTHSRTVSFRAYTEAPRSSSSAQTFARPLKAAKCSAVRPCFRPQQSGWIESIESD